MLKSITQHVLIHQFTTSDIMPSFDEEGDIRIGSYFQFIDELENPIGGLIGPYRTNELAEKAAHQAYRARDF